MQQNFLTNLRRTNPLVKYGLIVIGFPLVALITVLQGGSITDIFTGTVDRREVRQAVVTHVNDNQSTYRFTLNSASDVDCKTPLKNEFNASTECTLDVEASIGGYTQGLVTARVTLKSVRTDSSPARVDVQNITLVK
jgi:hypothetical protein